MRKVFGRAVYDSDAAECLHKYVQGAFGDPAGYEERLMRMPGGAHFIYGVGGESSPYPQPRIVRLARDRVQTWLEAHR